MKRLLIITLTTITIMSSCELFGLYMDRESSVCVYIYNDSGQDVYYVVACHLPDSVDVLSFPKGYRDYYYVESRLFGYPMFVKAKSTSYKPMGFKKEYPKNWRDFFRSEGFDSIYVAFFDNDANLNPTLKTHDSSLALSNCRSWLKTRNDSLALKVYGFSSGDFEQNGMKKDVHFYGVDYLNLK